MHFWVYMMLVRIFFRRTQSWILQEFLANIILFPRIFGSFWLLAMFILEDHLSQYFSIFFGNILNFLSWPFLQSRRVYTVSHTKHNQVFVSFLALDSISSDPNTEKTLLFLSYCVISFIVSTSFNWIFLKLN